MSQAEQQKSSTSSDRKERIMNLLFENRQETMVKINVFRGLLERFHGYVKVFQSEKPLVHTLHREMFKITREVLGMFIRPEFISDSVREVLKLDVTDEAIQKTDKEMQVGRYAYVEINKARLDKKHHHWVHSLYTDLRVGYIKAAQKLLKLPLGNQTLRKLAVLDPGLANHNQASKSIKALAHCLPNVIDEASAGSLAVEADKYTTDLQVQDFASNYIEQKMSVDLDFWSKVFSLKTFNEPRYPVLQLLISALLSIFSGPLIESTFNIMDDIVEKDRSKLTVENYEAIAIVKTTLKRQNVSAVNMVVDAQMKRSCIRAYATYQECLAKKKELAEKKKEEKLKASISLLKKEKAKRIAKLIRLKNRKQEREAIKRKRDIPCSSNGKKWKRIKLVD